MFRCWLLCLSGICGTGSFRTRLQAGIALLSLLQFSPKNLLGILGAAPYLLVALLCEKEKGIGGGDVKLAGAMGLVLGLRASLTASCLGLTGFVLYGAAVHLWERHHGKEGNLPFLWDRFWQ